MSVDNRPEGLPQPLTDAQAQWVMQTQADVDLREAQEEVRVSRNTGWARVRGVAGGETGRALSAQDELDRARERQTRIAEIAGLTITSINPDGSAYVIDGTLPSDTTLPYSGKLTKSTPIKIEATGLTRALPPGTRPSSRGYMGPKFSVFMAGNEVTPETAVQIAQRYVPLLREREALKTPGTIIRSSILPKRARFLLRK